jgi:tRNA dimethylallyltransferase
VEVKDMPNKLLVVVAGPTASGKTNVAIQLAQHFGTEIVNADSRQIYKELNIGVGKPDADQLSAVPHHLISHATIFEPYSAGHYTTDALTVLYTIFSRHDIAILSGGTGLYIKSVIEGFDPMPEVPANVTEHWTKIWEQQGTGPLIEALREKDPDYLASVDQANHARLIRAVAVSDHSGKPFSSFRLGVQASRPFNVTGICLDLPRNNLYERIDRRVDQMLANGWIDEARALHLYRHLKALHTLGYEELFEVIDGKLTMEHARSSIQQATRRYAKRQLTWLRNQGNWACHHPEDLQGMIQLIEAALRKTRS